MIASWGIFTFLFWAEVLLIGYIIYDFVVLKMEIEKKIKELTAGL